MSGASLDDFKDRLHVSVSTLDTWYMDEAVSVQTVSYTHLEEDFLETMDVVEKVGFDSAFTFIYSKRTGTPAASMENQAVSYTHLDVYKRQV